MPPPMKLAIIGGGPSAFYVASRLLALHPQDHKQKMRVHLFDRLWAPHGLVRYGVAPDHPEVKNCTHKFDATALDPRFRFFGNVNINFNNVDKSPIRHNLSLPFSSLLNTYTHLVFATGCTLPTLHPSLTPSSHCIPALSLVHWYTQHPSCNSFTSIAKTLANTTHVSLIGTGNVALDVARILLSPPSRLSSYDVPQPILNALSHSKVKHVSIYGRRGPKEAAFTSKELREMLGLEGVAMKPIPEEILETGKVGEGVTRQQGRILDMLRKGSKEVYGTTDKTWSLEFYKSPTRLTLPLSVSDSNTEQTQREDATLTLAHTRVNEQGKAVPTGIEEDVKTGLVITSLGFHAPEMNTMLGKEEGRIRPGQGGRVVLEGKKGKGELRLKNVYASGWASMGARGVLAATMMDAYGVAQTMLGDWLNGGGASASSTDSEVGVNVQNKEEEREQEIMATEINSDLELDAPPREIQDALRKGTVLEYGDWKKIDEEEQRRGEVVGKERERMEWEEVRTFLGN